MQPKLPADHPTTTPDLEPSLADRRDLVQPRPTVEEEVAIRDETRPPVLERLVEDLEAVASPLVPEAGVAEGGPGTSLKRNRILLVVAVVAAVAVLGLLLYLAN